MFEKLFGQKKMSFLLKIMLCAFLVLKVHRGFYGGVGTQGGVWNIIQCFFVFEGLILFFSPLQKSIMQWWGIFFTLFFLYIWLASFFPFVVNGHFSVPSIFWFFMKPYGFLVFLCFFYCGLYTEIKENRSLLMVVFVILCVLVVKSMMTYRYSLLIEDKGAVADVYYPLGLFPFILAISEKRLKIIFFSLLLFAVMMTGKRTGFICMSLLFVINFFVTLYSESKLKRFIFIVVVATSMILLQDVVVSYFNLDIFTRLGQLASDGGSGRSYRWNLLLDAMSYDTTSLQLILGHGSGATIAFTQHAHNDFLEILYDYGLVGVSLYILFYVFLVREMVKMKISGYPYVREFASTIVVMLFLAMFSFFAIDCMYIVCTSFCLGMFLADWVKFQGIRYYEVH